MCLLVSTFSEALRTIFDHRAAPQVMKQSEGGWCFDKDRQGFTPRLGVRSCCLLHFLLVAASPVALDVLLALPSVWLITPIPPVDPHVKKPSRPRPPFPWIVDGGPVYAVYCRSTAWLTGMYMGQRIDPGCPTPPLGTFWTTPPSSGPFPGNHPDQPGPPGAPPPRRH